MHELSLCRSLLRQILEVAEQHRVLAVTVVRLQVGPLSGVEPELLKTAFPLAAAGTLAESAKLNLTATCIEVYCGSCKKRSRAASNQLSCTSCGSCSTQLVSGDELILESVELTLDELSAIKCP
ncbi:hydrogenase maturation nickel metallochaperone HypA [Vreelandella rituensis]|uniref:Hydrogenase maturation factor HypA n=1 Tax=Vreelandella rituensis TaxID=2282306 RepID=A0A368TNX3_9GAMM|nr:hydrogenase maturation nickel metallochaperone HypA [Halomonas rituensis]RCV86006.1 hydrogenase maturation nickel metallochaperone HypA [Halomonas rituensis]